MSTKQGRINNKKLEIVIKGEAGIIILRNSTYWRLPEAMGMKASKGFKRGTRSRLRRKTRDKFRVGDFLKQFKADERVAVKINPSSHKGMPHPRFDGKIGRIKEKRGDSYVVEVSIGNSKRSVIARPEHLKHAK